MPSTLYVAIVVVYVLVMLGVGWVSMRRTKDARDFFIGGRSLGPWMSAFAYGTTYFSAVLFIGYAGKLGTDARWLPVRLRALPSTYRWQDPARQRR